LPRDIVAEEHQSATQYTCVHEMLVGTHSCAAGQVEVWTCSSARFIRLGHDNKRVLPGSVFSYRALLLNAKKKLTIKFCHVTLVGKFTFVTDSSGDHL
jgi:hypothetical protein